MRIAVVFATFLLSTAAAADDPALPPAQTPGRASLVAPPYGFGARVGGYGFRDVEGNDWNDCRMNGLGVFAERRFGPSFFTELGLDFYNMTTDSFMDEGLDRTSGLLTVSAGFRMFPRAIVSPFVQVGVGAEYTRVTIDSRGFDQSYLLPLGFVGAGGDVHIGDHMRLGITIRALLMGGFEVPATDQTPSPTVTPAAQVQFFARYDL